MYRCNPRQREGLKSFEEDRYRPYWINSLTLGKTQSGVDKHLETKVLDTGSMKDKRPKTEQGRALLLCEI